MIRKDLKVGDKFTDGNRTFIVQAVVSEGVYISKVVDSEEEAPIVEEKKEVKEEKTFTKTEINRMPKDKLEDLSKEYGLEIGTTTVMKENLIKALGL